MDTLDYGISSPQLALLKDGSVFVAGQYEPPMTPPTAQNQTQTMGSKLRAMDAGIPATITAGSDLFGTIAPILPLFQVKSVQFQSGIPVSNSYGTSTVQGPNWTYGVNLSDGDGSSMPAVYLVNGNSNSQNVLTVNLSIDEAWKGHTGTLVGTLQESSLASWGHAPLQFTSVNNFSLNDTSSTGLTIPMTVANLPTTMDWYRGDAQWTVSLDDGRQFKLPGTTRLELFVIWDTPGSIYLPKGVWPEVLRKVFTYSSLDGASSKDKAIAKITSYLHGGTGLVYNVEGGGSPNYIDKPSGSILGGPFKLKSYLSDPAENPVNCYDQAGAIQTFAGAIGLQTQWIYSYPFGYIPGVSPDTGLQLPSTDLIGVGLTNNPFGTPLILNWNDIDRTFFVNHVFVMYNNQIYDACAGPHLGTGLSPNLSTK